MNNKVRIYRPTKNPMQSGRRNTRQWVIEVEPSSPKIIDPLMGWTGSKETKTQVRLKFRSKDSAIAYAERNNLDYCLEEPKERIVKPKNYADNFS